MENEIWKDIERYENMTNSDLFKNAYENKSVGDMLEIEN